MRALVAILCLCWPAPGLAAPSQPRAKAAVAPAPAAHVVGLSLAYQAPLDLDKVGPGAGLVYTREFFITARSALGIHGGFRIFPAAPAHYALTYGLTLKHYLLSPEAPSTGFYVLYGLLQQWSFLEGRDGSANDHDTLLAVGYDWPAGRVHPTLQAGYHITRTGAFEAPTVWWSYADLTVGLRF